MSDKKGPEIGTFFGQPNQIFQKNHGLAVWPGNDASDLAVEKIYRLRPFKSDEERLEYLFKQYDKMVKKKGWKN